MRDAAERQARQAARIVQDLLGLGAAATLRVEPVPLADVVVAAAEAAEPVVAARGHRLATAVPPGVAVAGDPGRLIQVFTNLLVNAARYTDPGGEVRVSAAVEVGVVVRVRDTGRGIPADLLPHVFDPFRRGAVPGEPGLGLGLAVVKTLVERHGGTVTAHSDGPGTGSEFVVRLPAADGAR